MEGHKAEDSFPSKASSFTSSSSDVQLEKPQESAFCGGIGSDGGALINLPFRTLASNAKLDEFITESPAGHILEKRQTARSGRIQNYELVTFKLADPENPKNWSKGFKWWCTMCVAFTCFVVAFNSAVITADVLSPAVEFDVSREVSLLAITLFVVGFGVGPMLFAPLSEIAGRRIIYASTLLIATIFVIPAAVAKNIQTLLVARAIGGIAFSAPMVLVGGTLADLWKNEERGIPMAAFSAAPFIGPSVGPLCGGFIADNLGWRWLYWIQLILSGVAWLLITFTVPETYAPTLLARRAKKLCIETGDAKYVTEAELDKRPYAERLKLFLIRPFQLLFLEPIVLFISIFMSVLYGLLYMFFVAYPIVFQGGKGWSASSTGLMFIPLAIGVLASAACAPLVNKHYLSLVRKHGGKPPAEARLIPMMVSCWLIPIGLFIFAWTSYPRLSWWGPALGGFPVGFGFILLYNAANNYLLDSYQHQAASALAAKTCIRSFWGGSTVLFTEQMYERLGDQWASSLLGFIALACCAIPYVFYVKGKEIRAYSRFAYASDEEDAGAKPLDGYPVANITLMLTRRIIRQLTDFALSPAFKPLACFCADATPLRPRLAAPILARQNVNSQVLRRASSSSTRWKSRQSRDPYTKASRLSSLKSRAAFKLLGLHQQYRLFRPGQTVVDLGYAPGSWSQVAQTKTQPGGRVVGIDILPVQPPRGVSTIQGNFLSAAVREEVRRYLSEAGRGRIRSWSDARDDEVEEKQAEGEGEGEERYAASVGMQSYVDMERNADLALSHGRDGDAAQMKQEDTNSGKEREKQLSRRGRDEAAGRTVDVLLSDMLQNTSGIPFRDHSGSMDLCYAALTFAFDNLRVGGSFVCKFYQGGEDKKLEEKLKALFEKVSREKPEASRVESKEAYFVARGRREEARREDVL